MFADRSPSTSRYASSTMSFSIIYFHSCSCRLMECCSSGSEHILRLRYSLIHDARIVWTFLAERTDLLTFQIRRTPSSRFARCLATTQQDSSERHSYLRHGPCG